MKNIFLIGIDLKLKNKLIKIINEYDKNIKIIIIDNIKNIKKNVIHEKPYLVIINIAIIIKNISNIISILRQNNELYYIPIIIISNHELDNINKKKLQKHNIDHFVVKPITKDKIYTCLKFIERIKNLEDGFYNIVKSYKINFERHQLFQNIIETVQVIILLLDIKGHIINFNQYMEKISGYNLKEVQYKDWFTTFLEKKNQEKTKELFLKAIKDIQTEGNIDTIVTKNGNLLYIEWYDKTLKDNNGNIKGLVCIGLNITERKKTENALIKSEERYRSIVENLNDCLFIHDFNGIILDVNENSCSLLGYAKDELIGSSLSKIVSIEYKKLIPVHIKELINKGKMLFESELITNDYRLISINVSGKIVSYDNNGIVQSFVRDITKQKQIEKNLREDEERLKILFDCAPDAYYLTDLEGKFIDINKTTEIISGLKREDLIGKKITDTNFLSQDFLKKVLFNLEKNKQGLSTGPDEFRINIKNSENTYLEIYTFPVQIQNKNYVLNIVRNVTDRKLLEEEKMLKETLMHRLERFTSLGHLSSAISHEIKQPLQSIKVLTDSMLYLESINKKLSYEEILEDIKEISNRVDKINKIITNLNYLIKAPEKIEIKDININQEIEKAVNFYNKKLMSHCISLELKLKNENLTGIASEIQFQQILINILNNSINALDNIDKNDKKIIITTNYDEENIIIEIIDNGTGFDESQKENLFNPFYSINAKEDNFGLGLYIVCNILKCFLGSIDINNNEYKGTTVTLKLKKKGINK